VDGLFPWPTNRIAPHFPLPSCCSSSRAHARTFSIPSTLAVARAVAVLAALLHVVVLASPHTNPTPTPHEPRMMRLPLGDDGGAGAAPPPPRVVSKTRDLLSRHSTRATFAGVREQKCRHLTSLCPDACGHGMTLALFNVTEYLSYEKPGQYGDEKATVYHLRLSGGPGGHDDETATPEQRATVEGLAVGDAVLLDWNHDYVTTTWEGGGSGKSPERPCTKLVKA
jgi:hypothetical protein